MTASDTFFSTWQRAAFRPSALYEGTDPERRRFRPLLFAVVVGLIVAPVGALLQGLEGAVPRVVRAVLVSPVATVASVYVSAALLHVGLIVVGGRKAAFRETTAAVCYSHAPLIFGVVPILGTAVGAVWSVVVLCAGVAHAHKTAVWRVVVAAMMGLFLSPVFVALFLRAFVVEAFKIPSGSMTPSVVLGDHVFVDKLAYGPLIPFTDARLYTRMPPPRGEIIVFKFPDNHEQDFVKRVIAVPGDTLEVVNGRPVLNGWLVPHCRVGAFRYENRTAELFVEHLGDRSFLTLFDTDPDEPSCGTAVECAVAGYPCRGGVCGTLQGPFKVAPGEVWVVGDNRNNSHDSRSWRGGIGAGVPFELIKGRPTLVWMSFGPGGAIAQDRFFVHLNGAPVLPGGHEDLQPALARCMRERPTIAETSPPPPTGRYGVRARPRGVCEES